MAKKRDYVQEVEDAIRRYMSENDDKIPPRRWVAKEIGASLRDVNPVMEHVLGEIAKVATRLSTLGAVPEDLKSRAEAYVEGVWTHARELANTEIKEMRGAHEIVHAEHRRNMADATDTIYALEDELETEQSQRQACEAENTKLLERIAMLEKELLQERARAGALETAIRTINATVALEPETEDNSDLPKPGNSKRRGKPPEEPEQTSMPLGKD